MSSELHSWLLLSLLPQLGPVTLNRLRQVFPDGQSILSQPLARLKTLGLRKQSLQALDQWRQQSTGGFSQQLQHQLSHIEHWQQQPGHRLISIGCPQYPPLLKEIDDPPAVIYLCGDPDVLNQPQVAIVGSRNASIGGRESAFGFARQLSLSGWIPTSGLALGIDAEAHRGGLAGMGLTVAVMATGVDQLYPRRHQQLAQQIVAEGGAIISELPLGTAPRAQLFPRRNRIISGLSMATLVVEATLNSGSLITAQQALEQGREVFAIPGSIHNPMSKGCHELIRQGAKLVERVDHIYEELAPQLNRPEPDKGTNEATSTASAQLTVSQLPNEQQRLIEATGYEPTSVDQLVERTNLATEQVTSLMLELELKGWVSSVTGGYQRL